MRTNEMRNMEESKPKDISWKDSIGKRVVLLNKQGIKPVEEIGKVLELMENGCVARIIWDEVSGMQIGFIHTRRQDKWELIKILDE